VKDISFDSMVRQLTIAFGSRGKIIFALGFWAAAFSSFITNSLIAGLMLSDGLGIGGQLNAMTTKVCATLALLVGMSAAVAVIEFESRPPQANTAIVEIQPKGVADGSPSTRAVAIPQPATAPKRDIKVTTIAIGQASSLVAVPLAAVAMVVVLFDRQATRGHGLPAWAKAFVLFGALVLLGVAVTTLTKLWPQLVQLFGGEQLASPLLP
jgi:hypothetical protein